MYKRNLILTGLAVTASINVWSQQKTNHDRQNILFIVCDDLRPELGCYGRKQIKSPNIDRWATQSVLFDRAYCNIAVSGASRASLLTGLRPTKICYRLGMPVPMWMFLTQLPYRNVLETPDI